MDFKGIFEKISKRKKFVVACGNKRNNMYSEYLKASLSYDNYKKGFYLAIDLSKHDGDAPIEQLERYESLIKHFDQHLVAQLKQRDNEIPKIHVDSQNDIDTGDIETDDIETDDIETNKMEQDNNGKHEFHDRILKIETEGLLRNRIYFEFIDYKNDFNEAKTLFYKENSLARRDGLITDIDYKMHSESLKTIEIDLEEGMTRIWKEYCQKRVLGYSDLGRRDPRRNDSVQGRDWRGHGRGRNGRGLAYNGYCRERVNGRERSGHGRRGNGRRRGGNSFARRLY